MFEHTCRCIWFIVLSDFDQSSKIFGTDFKWIWKWLLNKRKEKKRKKEETPSAIGPRGPAKPFPYSACSFFPLRPFSLHRGLSRRSSLALLPWPIGPAFGLAWQRSPRRTRFPPSLAPRPSAFPPFPSHWPTGPTRQWHLFFFLPGQCPGGTPSRWRPLPSFSAVVLTKSRSCRASRLGNKAVDSLLSFFLAVYAVLTIAEVHRDAAIRHLPSSAAFSRSPSLEIP